MNLKNCAMFQHRALPERDAAGSNGRGVCMLMCMQMSACKCMFQHA